MGELVQLDSYRPHKSGSAVCLHCRYAWAAVVPLGVRFFECPACHTLNGVHAAPMVPEHAFVCECGGWVYCILPDLSVQCVLCGAIGKLDDYA